eukprot:2782020-Pyramimonas_sp.AAC.1
MNPQPARGARAHETFNCLVRVAHRVFFQADGPVWTLGNGRNGHIVPTGVVRPAMSVGNRVRV